MNDLFAQKEYEKKGREAEADVERLQGNRGRHLVVLDPMFSSWDDFLDGPLALLLILLLCEQVLRRRTVLDEHRGAVLMDH